MEELKCSNCGAPLKVRPRDIKKGVAVCEFCGNTYQFGSTQTELDEDVKRGLRLLSKIKAITGLELATEEEVDGPVSKPNDSKIDLENKPGVRFVAKIPSAGLSVGTLFLSIFTVFWCGFMLMWNTIGMVQGLWMMVGFGLLHDLIGVFLFITTTWSIFGKEELEAKGESFIRIRRLFGIPKRNVYPLLNIDDVIFKTSSRQTGKIRKGLYLNVGTKKVRIASNASFPEIKWLRYELQRFFEPRW